MVKQISLLGSTGSIGTQSLDVIRAQGYGCLLYTSITADTGNEPLRSKLFSLGADYCLSKPYTLQKLFERAQLICGKEPQAPLPRVRRLLDRLALVPNDCGYLYLEDAVQAMVRTKAPHALVRCV